MLRNFTSDPFLYVLPKRNFVGITFERGGIGMNNICPVSEIQDDAELLICKERLRT